MSQAAIRTQSDRSKCPETSQMLLLGKRESADKDMKECMSTWKHSNMYYINPGKQIKSYPRLFVFLWKVLITDPTVVTMRNHAMLSVSVLYRRQQKWLNALCFSLKLAWNLKAVATNFMSREDVLVWHLPPSHCQ